MLRPQSLICPLSDQALVIRPAFVGNGPAQVWLCMIPWCKLKKCFAIWSLDISVYWLDSIFLLFGLPFLGPFGLGIMANMPSCFLFFILRQGSVIRGRVWLAPFRAIFSWQCMLILCESIVRCTVSPFRKCLWTKSSPLVVFSSSFVFGCMISEMFVSYFWVSRLMLTSLIKKRVILDYLLSLKLSPEGLVGDVSSCGKFVCTFPQHNNQIVNLWK